MVRNAEPLPGLPYSSTFLFEIDGQEIARFSEVSGLEVTAEVYEYDEGGVNG